MSNANAIVQVLSRFPRVRLAHAPTPARFVFFHTGGVPALFGYISLFQRVLERDAETASGVSGLTAVERS